MWCRNCAIGGYYDAMTQAWYCVMCGARLVLAAPPATPDRHTLLVQIEEVGFTTRERTWLAFQRWRYRQGALTELET